MRDAELLVWMGDFNYRIDESYEKAKELIRHSMHSRSALDELLDKASHTWQIQSLAYTCSRACAVAEGSAVSAWMCPARTRVNMHLCIRMQSHIMASNQVQVSTTLRLAPALALTL